jgi:myo-inositol-1(or 4)-monophosphatase
LAVSTLELEAALSIARGAARDASEIALEGWRKGAEIRKKGAIDLVTDYDLASERAIRATLGAAFPSHRIVGEEHETRAGESSLTWYVDPIDGTTNYAHGHPFFAISIALYDGDVGLVGVVEAPALGACWTAVKGGGAFRNDAPVSVSDCAALGDALSATGFPYDCWTSVDDNVAETTALLKRVRGIRRCGSAAIDLAFVADGTYDLYWEKRLSAWDMAAGAVLVLEAGGALSDFSGGVGRPLTGTIVASNGRFHDDAVAVLKSA